MQVKIPILAAMTILVTVIAIPLATHPVGAVNDTVPTPWSVYGNVPSVNKLVLHEYGADAAERAGFVAGQLDVMDNGQSAIGVPPSQYATYENNPDWLITPKASSAVFYGIFFNYESSHWANMGCDWNHGNSQCGIEIREAFAHLVDNARTISDGPAQGSALPIVNDLPLSKLNDGPPGTNHQQPPFNPAPYAMGTPLTPAPALGVPLGQCQWDSIASHRSSCISAFNLVADPGGNPAVVSSSAGPSDWCAAVEHLLRASTASSASPGPGGITLQLNADPASGTDSLGDHCGIDPASPSLQNPAPAGAGQVGGNLAHQMRAKIRSTDPRLTLGTKLANAMDTIFHVVATNRQIGSGGVIGTPIVFSCCDPSFPTDDWDWYTYGYQDTGPFPTTLFTLVHSQFASNLCGPSVVPGTTQGVEQVFPNNPTFVCIASLDTTLVNMINDGTEAQAYNDAYTALDIMGSHAQDIPVMSLFLRGASLREGTGWVNAFGLAYENVYNFFAVQKGSYNQVDGAGRYHFGGGDLTTLRWGQAGGGLVTFLNPYNAEFVWEFNALGEVYDSLYFSNPTNPQQFGCWMCSTSNYGGQNFFDPVTGLSHYFFQLRQNIKWQDDLGGANLPFNPAQACPAGSTTNGNCPGVALDAYDVKFSILSERDNAAVLSGNDALVKDVNVLSSTVFEVIVNGQGFSNQLNIGGTFIVPRHIWEVNPPDNKYGQGVSSLDPAKLDPSYDDVAAGTFIGSGQYECRSIFPADLGKLGTGCTVNSDGSRGGQALDPDATLHLTLFDNTGVGGNTDPYNQWFRNSNSGWGHGAGTSAQDGQFQEFSWVDKTDDGAVTLSDTASIAACNGKTAAGPSDATHCPDYAYWIRNALHPGTPGQITTELTVAGSHYDDTWIDPFVWAPTANIDNIVPFNNGGLTAGP